ncbi:hypothetical protein [Neptunicella marina]|uniref:Lipoprotein n=1 Tax=Neptunicella marina TaxID=2125989 RepID=A0A8J6ISZ9_9ALTE|nr:hypothetical protein [Neptunicella marina]MBC3766201.1 hypothetical protein [Neptunicella marina]
MSVHKTKIVCLAGISCLLVSACSSGPNINAKELASGALGDLSNSHISYNPAQCQVIKSRCMDGSYAEWPTSDGKTGCSCNK